MGLGGYGGMGWEDIMVMVWHRVAWNGWCGWYGWYGMGWLGSWLGGWRLDGWRLVVENYKKTCIWASILHFSPQLRHLHRFCHHHHTQGDQGYN